MAFKSSFSTQRATPIRIHEVYEGDDATSAVEEPSVAPIVSID